MRDALNSTGHAIFYSLCEWLVWFNILSNNMLQWTLKILILLATGAKMIQLYGLVKLEIVGVQQMT